MNARRLAPRGPRSQERQEQLNDFILGALGFLALLAQCLRLQFVQIRGFPANFIKLKVALNAGFPYH
jgi:hypothetical protein